MVRQGTDWVPGVDLTQVAALVGVTYDPVPALSASTLVDRLVNALVTSDRLIRQFPEPTLGDRLPNRDRTCLGLANHIVEIVARLLEVSAGADFDHAASSAEPVHERNRDALANHAAMIVQQLQESLPLADADEQPVDAFFGTTTLHAVLERCTWHVMQHVRQQAMLLERLGIRPDRPLGEADFAGLPLPEAVWDS